jgi:succinate-semialdehyde dehydrogenase/glutarate-semialdehyde dehydrogenase
MPAMSQKALLESVPTQLFIGGEWRGAEAGATLDVYDPATGRVLTSVADGSPADGMAALDAAVAAQADWAKVAPRDRSELLRAAYEKLVERTEEFALLMTLEMGKPLAEARGEVTYGAEFFRWFAEEAVRIGGDMRLSGDGATRIFVSRQPVGPERPRDHALELPARHGHPQDRPGHRGRLHDGVQAGTSSPR